MADEWEMLRGGGVDEASPVVSGYARKDNRSGRNAVVLSCHLSCGETAQARPFAPSNQASKPFYMFEMIVHRYRSNIPLHPESACSRLLLRSGDTSAMQCIVRVVCSRFICTREAQKQLKTQCTSRGNISTFP